MEREQIVDTVANTEAWLAAVPNPSQDQLAQINNDLDKVRNQAISLSIPTTRIEQLKLQVTSAMATATSQTNGYDTPGIAAPRRSPVTNGTAPVDQQTGAATSTQPPDPADNDEFVCEKCGTTHDIEDSTRFRGELLCPECAPDPSNPKDFGQQTGDERIASINDLFGKGGDLL